MRLEHNSNQRLYVSGVNDEEMGLVQEILVRLVVLRMQQNVSDLPESGIHLGVIVEINIDID